MNTTYRVGAIGRTGQGDYGHDLDIAYQDIPGVQFVAVADPDPEGLRAAGKRTGAERLYSDYHEMLAKEKLDIVSVCPRWIDCHAEMVIACAEAGVKGIFCEKPLARTLAEADAMIEACDRNGVRMAVAHRRASAYEQHAKKIVGQGVIGEIRVMRGHGKADDRAGAMDLMVLGTHILDSMRFFAGSDVAWAHGHVTQDGREMTLQDIQEGDEGVGLLAGNGVAAYYVFKNGITAHYESYRGDRPGSRWFGFEIYGTKGIISLRNSPGGEMYLYPYGLWIPGEADGTWERILLEEWEKRPDGQIRSGGERTRLSNRMIVEEMIQAIEGDRDVVACSSGRDARAALEMIMAVHESQRLKTRVDFPLQNRENPYETWRRQQGC
ncbi:MAG: Gfo/Idh/MocA family oxidoreductase [Candidatus Latescibacteria bacterium]|nr:Gfo/Idh/MocA family oxidoreductase [Candidatus Latescibacterota bacterium]